MDKACAEDSARSHEGGVIDKPLLKNDLKPVALLDAEEVNGPGIDLAEADCDGGGNILVREGFIQGALNRPGNRPLDDFGGPLNSLNIQTI